MMMNYEGSLYILFMIQHTHTIADLVTSACMTHHFFQLAVVYGMLRMSLNLSRRIIVCMSSLPMTQERGIANVRTLIVSGYAMEPT
jgi:hypothetical protein